MSSYLRSTKEVYWDSKGMFMKSPLAVFIVLTYFCSMSGPVINQKAPKNRLRYLSLGFSE
jgi:hypothetical protein